VYGAHASERQMQMGDIFSLFCVIPHMYVAGQLAALVRVLAHAAPLRNASGAEDVCMTG
jgi:hypothetical protein